MDFDLYLGKARDEKIANKFREMGPKFDELMRVYTNRARTAGTVVKFNRQYFSDAEIADVVRFLLRKYNEYSVEMYKRRFAKLTKANGRFLRVSDEQKRNIVWFDLMKEFLVQNPQLNAAIKERQNFDAELQMFGLPAGIDHAKENILKLSLQRKSDALEQDEFNPVKHAAYTVACNKMSAYLRYQGLVASKVIKPLKTR